MTLAVILRHGYSVMSHDLTDSLLLLLREPPYLLLELMSVHSFCIFDVNFKNDHLPFACFSRQCQERERESLKESENTSWFERIIVRRFMQQQLQLQQTSWNFRVLREQCNRRASLFQVKGLSSGLRPLEEDEGSILEIAVWESVRIQ